MPDQKDPRQSDSHEEEAKNVQPADELTEDEMDNVAGGRDQSAPSISEIVVTKPVDTSSPKLLN